MTGMRRPCFWRWSAMAASTVRTGRRSRSTATWRHSLMSRHARLIHASIECAFGRRAAGQALRRQLRSIYMTMIQRRTSIAKLARSCARWLDQVLDRRPTIAACYRRAHAACGDRLPQAQAVARRYGAERLAFTTDTSLLIANAGLSDLRRHHGGFAARPATAIPGPSSEHAVIAARRSGSWSANRAASNRRPQGRRGSLRSGRQRSLSVLIGGIGSTVIMIGVHREPHEWPKTSFLRKSTEAHVRRHDSQFGQQRGRIRAGLLLWIMTAIVGAAFFALPTVLLFAESAWSRPWWP